MQLGSRVALAVSRLAAVVLIQSLAWELPYATGETLKRKKKKRKERKQANLIKRIAFQKYYCSITCLIIVTNAPD